MSDEATQVEEVVEEVQQESPQQAPWYDGFDEPLVKVAERYTSAQEAVKALDQFKRSHTKSAAELDELKKAVPQSVDDYGIDLDTVAKDWGDELIPDRQMFEERINGVLKTMQESGVPKQAVDKLIAWEKERQIADRAAINQQLVKMREDAEASLKREWGADYDTNNAAATAFVKKFGDDAFRDFVNTAQIDGVTLGNHPAFIALAARAGRMLLEGDVYTANTPEAMQTLEDEWTELHNKYLEARGRGDWGEADKWYEKKSAVSQKIVEARDR